MYGFCYDYVKPKYGEKHVARIGKKVCQKKKIKET